MSQVDLSFLLSMGLSIDEINCAYRTGPWFAEFGHAYV